MLKAFYLCWAFLAAESNLALLNCNQIDGPDDPAIVSAQAGNPNTGFFITELTITLMGSTVKRYDVTMKPPPTLGPRGKKLGEGPVEVILTPAPIAK